MLGPKAMHVKVFAIESRFGPPMLVQVLTCGRQGLCEYCVVTHEVFKQEIGACAVSPFIMSFQSSFEKRWGAAGSGFGNAGRQPTAFLAEIVPSHIFFHASKSTGVPARFEP
jgi:hypothetical protein